MKIRIIIFIIPITTLLSAYGIAHPDELHSHNLYAVTTDAKLLTIDTTNAIASEVGNLGISFPSPYVGMDLNIEGTLYVGRVKGNYIKSI